MTERRDPMHAADTSAAPAQTRASAAATPHAGEEAVIETAAAAIPIAELPLTIAGESMVLLSERALYWPARRRLLIADLHLGKGDTFRAAGIAMPSGGTLQDLTRLEALIAATGAAALWVLGDLQHAPNAPQRWRSAWDAWRVRHPALELVALRGNHDRGLDPVALGITLAGEHVVDGPFLLCHDPDAARSSAHAGLHALGGHLHPVVRLPGVRGRLPALWLRADRCVLPAFSAFTGGWMLQPAAGERVAVCAAGAVQLLPQRG